MKFNIIKNDLLKGLQQVGSLLVKNQSFPILENILIKIKENILSLTATNLETEIITTIPINYVYQTGSIVVSGKKLLNICRNLPNQSMIQMEKKNNKINIISNNSFFSLITIPSKHFPNLCQFEYKKEFYVSQFILRKMILATQFSMANQDIRYYLNGMLFDIKEKNFRTVTTDGYRMAVYNTPIDFSTYSCSIIIPRKSILELVRLLHNCESLLHILIGKNNIRINIENITFTSKLISGVFPNYNTILLHHPIKIIGVKISTLKKSLLRVAILSNQNIHGIHLYLHNGKLEISAKNQEEEEAKEIIDLIYFANVDFRININVNYILDVLNTLTGENVYFLMQKNTSKIQLEEDQISSVSYIIMPLHI
ncbi:DNA polymerase III subunit beta [Buchnera aphidicola (Pemphigus obesinymphae)]|uniref:DNA polymerase III subunit beta n=1 Tax=Buchnera aphidicola TaxID=9 RepID=UPI002237D018|nr:DNA polymerase III subunit beta [Buchnera aphidicola]MCW5196771.1 DNA polymerase III subunit beta [Buchnera aphidicola (Pemphigus obesinymphae)]